ncbi:MAG: ABC transporter permease subunit [Candidatus Omnitrophota bacterium]
MNSTLRMIWRERPRLINNPVILRELVERLRKKSSFVYLFLFLGMGVFVFSLIWYEFLLNMGLNTAQWERQARELFMVLNCVEGICILLMIPLFSATCVNLEYERDSWELLSTTPLSLASILLGKFLSSVFFVWILMLSLVPIYGLCATVGGISPNEILFIYGMATELVAVCGLGGLLCSIAWKRTIHSISAAYIFTLCYTVGLILLLVIIYPHNPGILLYCSPIILAVLFFSGPLGSTQGLFAKANPYAVHGIFVICVILILLCACYWMLARKIERFNAGKSRKFFRTLKFRAILSYDSFPFLTQLLMTSRDLIAWKELREMWRCKHIRLILSLGALAGLNVSILLIGLHLSDGRMRINEWHYAAAIIATLLAPCFILPYAANGIRGERDRETWHLLSTTTLKPQAILWGKFQAGLWIFALRFSAFYGFSSIIFLLHPYENINPHIGFGFWLGSVAINFAAACLYMSIGLFFSAWTRKTITAYALSFGSVLFIFFGFIFLNEFVHEVFALRNDHRFFEPIYSVLSPICMVIFHSESVPIRNSFPLLVFLQSSWMLIASMGLFILTWLRIDPHYE